MLDSGYPDRADPYLKSSFPIDFGDKVVKKACGGI